jgi:hypothetical protein
MLPAVLGFSGNFRAMGAEWFSAGFIVMVVIAGASLRGYWKMREEVVDWKPNLSSESREDQRQSIKTGRRLSYAGLAAVVVIILFSTQAFVDSANE